MAAGTFNFHNSGIKECIVDGDFGSDAYYAILLIGYTQDLSDTQYSDVSSAEVTGTDYGPIDVTSKTTGLVSGGPTVALDFADLSWGDPVTIEANFVVILKGNYASPGSSDYILGSAELETGTTKASVAGAFSVALNASGLATVGQA